MQIYSKIFIQPLIIRDVQPPPLLLISEAGGLQVASLVSRMDAMGRRKYLKTNSQ